MPALEMVEDDKAYRLTAELPGLAVISGEKEEEARKEKGFLLSERRYGSLFYPQARCRAVSIGAQHADPQE